MPYSFTKIEEDKSKTIRLVFSVLIFFYFASFWTIASIVKTYIYNSNSAALVSFQWQWLDVAQTMVVLGVALAAGYGHWQYTITNLVERILGVLGAEKLNPSDSYHRMFRNIVDEVSVATGGVKIETVVVPTVAMNAFAIADFSGRSVIGVTEGILARLSRAQIEAVVGHEAAHVVTGDCLATTVTSSLFELYSGLLKGFELMLNGSGNRRSIRVRGSGSGGVVALIVLIYLLLKVTRLLSQTVRMFISRQREFRADAIAVRLTRDPLSLAEALYAIKYRWRGNGLAAQELEAIFTVNPNHSNLDESDGALANLFSTHPPMERRLRILMDMAHTDAKTMIDEVERKSHRVRTEAPEAVASTTQWVVNQNSQWKGPYNLIELMNLGWLKPETWVKQVGEDVVKMAYEEPDINSVIGSHRDRMATSAYECPRCHIPLNLVQYEGTEAYKCSFCRGTLVDENNIKRIIIRQEIGFPERIQRLAGKVRELEQSRDFVKIDRDPKTLYVCPKCQHKRAKMLRMFYTEVYRVEIDKCFTCGLIWFDADELETLQCLIEDASQKV